MENNTFTLSNSSCFSDDIRALAQAFLLAQKEFTKTGKSGSNSHQKYTYAKIDEIYDAVKPALADNNIIIWHNSFVIEGIEYIQTRLIHTLTGQWSQDTRIKESEKPGNQGKGAADTYLKKYAVLCLCAIPTEDDDGEEEQKEIERGRTVTVSQPQEDELIALIRNATNGKEIWGNIKRFNTINELSELPSNKFENVKRYIIQQTQ